MKAVYGVFMSDKKKTSENNKTIVDPEHEIEIVADLPKGNKKSKNTKAKSEVKRNLPAPTPGASVVKFDPFQKYMSEIRQYDLLSREEEHDLAVEYKETGEIEIAHKLVTANLRLVVKIAGEYHKYWMNLLDLVQEGNIGLMQAVKRFDPYRGVKLSSYSSFWIKAYILKFIIDNWSLVKIGTTQAQRKLFFNLNKEKEKFALLGYDADNEQIAKSLDVKPELVTEMEQRMSGSDFSLDTPIGNDSEDRHIDFLESDKSDVDDRLADAELHLMFKSRLSDFRKLIKDKEAYIFDNRLLAESPKTLSSIGKHYNISRERIRQIESRLINKLRDYLQKESPELSDITIEQFDR